ncbi:hypothetical protein [Paenibacillus herberti]|uniref:RNA polymerase subunit sigma n=1 Tax=Paenibacillus herberti TaxID=1619309 RepID=A0A229P1T2_9BACL|nr:hypothetical protein [Paenibacillus herberti]OXM16011.1 hypothetical protein CGZ75_04715 [Paenibacillus herberti]
MPYRPIDLQLSVPRTQELGNQQSYLQGRLAAEARMQGEQAVKQTELDRSRSTELESRGDSKISYREKESGSGESPDKQEQASRSETDPKPQQIEHPFKGHRLDIRL